MFQAPRDPVPTANVAFSGFSISKREQSVFWGFAAVVLILLVTITVSNRGAVRIVGGVLLAGLLVWGLAQRLAMRPGPETGERGKPSSPATAIEVMPLESLKVDELQLSGGGAPFELRGVVANQSAQMRLRSITLQITRRDCFEGAIDPSGCAVVWQDRHWVQLDVAPNTERRFLSSFYAHTGVPTARGTLKTEFKLLAATGQAVEN